MAIYLVGLGLLAGVASEPLRFDRVRTAIVRQLGESLDKARAHAMTWEREVQGSGHASGSAAVAEPPARWVLRLEAVDAAIGRRDFSGAERAWHDAHTAALRTRTWRPLVAVGDAALKIGEAAGHRRAAASRARELYLAALIRARGA
ncbi:MAG: hypothetical protein FJZ38_19565, partial [Candidatus Rokubacteria bacterium]|nr:hypothetical protein [Candidatus Rokubacteria bacterium]